MLYEQQVKLILLFASYEIQMEEFLKWNSGLKRCIQYTFELKDYTPYMLGVMFWGELVRAGFIIPQDEFISRHTLKDCHSGLVEKLKVVF